MHKLHVTLTMNRITVANSRVLDVVKLKLILINKNRKCKKNIYLDEYTVN